MHARQTVTTPAAMRIEDLTPADRELAQAAMMRLYLGRRGLGSRGLWDRQFVRWKSTGAVHPRTDRSRTVRVTPTPHRPKRVPSGSSLGSPQWIRR